MNGVSEGHAATVANPLVAATGRATKEATAEGAALHRLEASRARIRAAMEAHAREIAAEQSPPSGAPRSLRRRLWDQVERLPIVRTVLAIRDLGPF